MAFSPTSKSYLILVNFGLLQFCLTLLLESDNDQGNENVDEEKRKDDKVDNIEDGHFHTEKWNGSLVLKGC